MNSISYFPFILYLQLSAQKGLGTTVFSEICSLLSLGFTIGFSIFLIGFVDWFALLHCKDEASCGENRSVYVHLISPFDGKPPSAYNFFVVLCFFLSLSMWIHQCYKAIHAIYDSIRMEHFFRTKLVGYANY